MIRPEEFGAVGDGRADDTRALQTALDRAGQGSVDLGGRSYATSATLLAPSGVTILGHGAVIRARADDQPVLVSAPWVQAGAPVRGRTRIAGLRIEATGRGTRQDGIVLHDFWSEIADCEIVKPGGRGIVLTAGNRAGVPIASTLVENRIRRCIVRDAMGTAFFLGEPANGKLTDGELSDCLASLRDDSTDSAVVIGHAAGWTVRDLHSYGGRPATAIEIRQAYFTRIDGLYVEGFVGVGLALPQVQTSVAVSNVQIAVERLDDRACFIALSGHRDYPAPRAQFSNVALTAAEPGAGVALLNQDGKVTIGGTPIVLAGPGAATLRPGDLPPASSAAGGAAPAARRIVTWTGRDARTIEIATVGGSSPIAGAFLLGLAARSSDGALTTAFTGMLTWTRAAQAQAVLVDLMPFGTPYGFQQLPTARVERRGDGIALTLSFTPVASGTGQLTVA